MENFQIIGRAGEGAHGFVYQVLDKRNLKVFALKRVSFNVDNGIPKNILREIFSLRALKSDYIVELFDVLPTSSGVALIMEYLPCTLADVIKDNELVLTLPVIKAYLKMFVLGVEYIHYKHIIHRDLKPANLLISNGGLKLADFGLARIFKPNEDRTYSHQVATRWYRAPELLYGSSKYTLAIDIWPIGCILVEMINRQPLFAGETDIEQLAIVLNTLGTPTEDTWPGLNELPDYRKISFTRSEAKSWESLVPTADILTLDLIKSIIQYDYNRRPTATQILNHPFFFEGPKACNLADLPDPIDVKNYVNAKLKDFDEIIKDELSES